MGVVHKMDITLWRLSARFQLRNSFQRNERRDESSGRWNQGFLQKEIFDSAKRGFEILAASAIN